MTTPKKPDPKTTQYLYIASVALAAVMIAGYYIYTKKISNVNFDEFTDPVNPAEKCIEDLEFDPEILDKSASPCRVPKIIIPDASDFRELTDDEMAEVSSAVEEHMARIPENFTLLDKLRELANDPEFLQQYGTNLFRYYKHIGKLVVELERDIAKEKKISQTGSGVDSLLDGKQTNDSIKEIKHFYANALRTKTLNYDLQAVIRELDKISGRQDIKDFIAGKLISFGTNFKTFVETFQHTMLMAPAGYGKTHVAKIIGNIFALSGIIQEGRLLITTKKSFVSPYINHTAVVTRNTLSRSVGGLLFIDEAYSLAEPNDSHGARDHGHEAVAEIVNFIDKYRGLNIIIAAGYQDKMERNFLGVNEGMSRRFPTKLLLTPYSERELAHICVGMIHQRGGFTGMNQEKISLATNLIYNAIVLKVNGRCTTAAYKFQAGDMDNLSAKIISEQVRVGDILVAIAVSVR